MKKDHKIRCVRYRDLPSISNMMRQGCVFCESDVRGLTRMIKDYLENPRGDELKTMVYSVFGEVAGFICFGKDLGDKTYEVYALSVAPKYQGNGVATKMIKAAEKYLRAKKARVLFISTSSSEEYLPARKLYLKNGYKKIATVRDFFNDGDHRIILSKRLKRPKPTPT